LIILDENILDGQRQLIEVSGFAVRRSVTTCYRRG